MWYTGKLPMAALCMALFFALSVPSALAGQWNQATKITFDQPVEIPGRVLPAGTYWFTLLDSPGAQNVVQIWNHDRERLVTMVLAVPDYRLHSKGAPVIKFSERPSDQPQALHAWFYPGDNFGHEFVYPETRARELAKRTGEPVLSMRDDVAANMNQPAHAATDKSAVALKHAEVKSVSPNGQETEVASNGAQTTTVVKH